MMYKEKLAVFCELLKCDGELSLWHYDCNFNILETNAKEALVLDTLFRTYFTPDMLPKRRNGDIIYPISIGTPFGLIWNVVFRQTGNECTDFYVLGPTFTMQVLKSSFDGIVRNLPDCLSIPIRSAFHSVLPDIPVIPQLLLTQNVCRLHYCINGQYITNADIISAGLPPMELGVGNTVHSPQFGRRMWQSEKELMRVIREGDSAHVAEFGKAIMIGENYPMYADEPLRMAQNIAILFITLCSRAAMDGGLAPERALTMAELYIQQTETAKSIPDISRILEDAYVRFTQNVRAEKRKRQVSLPIKRCCDYIEMHVEERIRLELLANEVNYSEFYLSKKFQEEMRCTIGQYIMKCKIRQAKFLLKNSDESIQAIAERLAFSSRSHFSSTFHKWTNMTPSEYRSSTTV